VLHSAIYGIGGSGKSTLAHTLARQCLANDWGVIILDPNDDAGWPAAGLNVRKVRTLAALVELAKRSQRCALFVDEAGEAIGHGKNATANQWITTRSRHWGHRTYIIALYATMVERSIRNQCGEAFVFRQSPDDAKALAQQYADDLLLTASRLEQGTFIHVRSCKRARLRRLAL
jgi:hypothetical protein